MHRMTAEPGCSGGPCPDLTEDSERGMTGGQAYIPSPADLPPELRESPPGEVRWEVPTPEWERLLAVHIDDAQWERISRLRAQLKVAV